MRRSTRPANLSTRTRKTNSPAPLLQSPASQVFSSPTSLTFSAASQSTSSLVSKPGRPVLASTRSPTPPLLPPPLVEPRRRGLGWAFTRCCVGVDDSDVCEPAGPVLRERAASSGRRSGAVMVVASTSSPHAWERPSSPHSASSRTLGQGRKTSTPGPGPVLSGTRSQPSSVHRTAPVLTRAPSAASLPAMYDPPFAPSSGTTPLSPTPGPYTSVGSGRRRNSSPATPVAGLGVPPARPYAARWASTVHSPKFAPISSDGEGSHRERSGLWGLVRTASVPAMHEHAMAAKSVVYTPSAVIIAYPPATAAYEDRQQLDTQQDHPQRDAQRTPTSSHSPAECYVASLQRSTSVVHPRGPPPSFLSRSSSLTHPTTEGGTSRRHPSQLPQIQVPPPSASLNIVARSPSPNAAAFSTRPTLMLHRTPRPPSGGSGSPPVSITRSSSLYGPSRPQSSYSALPPTPVSVVSSPALTVNTCESERSSASGLTFGKARNSPSEV